MPKDSCLNISDLNKEAFDQQAVQNFPLEAFLHWFKHHKRDLPWRHNPSFYEVLVSEFMLQQTVVIAAVPYYIRWMKQFPTLMHLAQASHDEVLKAWEGLGYYARARRLYQIAKTLVFEVTYLPETYEDLMSLKGIGDYTANAILAFAFKKPKIAVDGNVLRVGARFLGIGESIASVAVKKQIKGFFNACIKEDGTLAEALIELGALVCKKKAECHICPIKDACKAYHHNLQEKIPQVPIRKKIQKIESQIAICLCEDQVLITRHHKNLMKDLCEFPHVKDLELLGLKKENSRPLDKVKASYTCFQETLFPFIFRVDKKIDLVGYFWISIDSLDQLSFSSGHRKIKKQLQKTFLNKSSSEDFK